MQISVVMSAYNAEKYIAEAIDSVLNQSFTDFEFIIVDDGSTDSTLSIIKSYTDSRIVLIENEHNYIDSLNKGMQSARGKYIARMDADDLMHVDRLKIQYSIMEDEPNITVCCTQMNLFGEKVHPGQTYKAPEGLIESPLLVFLNINPIVHPSVMIRKIFLQANRLQYEHYPYAEDIKLWVEIAKLGGTFYVESQPLLFHRISESQVTQIKTKEQKETCVLIRDEIMELLVAQSPVAGTALKSLKVNLEDLNCVGLLDADDISKIFSDIFQKNRKTLIRYK